jgi:hypothetical protein
VFYGQWTALPDEKLAECDIAETNLNAALGLPGAEGLDIQACLRQVDKWVEIARHRTVRALPRWRAGLETDLPEGQFRMLALMTVLHRDLGVKYYLPYNDGEIDARDSRNLFIHGILWGHGGHLRHDAGPNRRDWPTTGLSAEDRHGQGAPVLPLGRL